MSLTKTRVIENIFDENECSNLYDHLVNNIEWNTGITSKTKGFTRYQAHGNMEEDPIVNYIVLTALSRFHEVDKCLLLGVYCNYYRDGRDFTPSHSHLNQKQVVISFGASRTLRVGKKDYLLKSGSAILFGCSQHEVPIEEHVKDGRVSVATFMMNSNTILSR